MNKALIKKEFKKSVRLGTGAAYLLIKKYPSVNFTKEIIYCATHNLAYDRQCEPSRAKYLYEIICLSAYKEEITKAILSVFLRQKSGFYDLDQMSEIAALMAIDGNKRARTVIYKRFGKNLLPDFQYCGNNALMEMDGINGLLRIADVVGQILQADPDDWEDGTREYYFQKQNPDIDVFQYLEDAAKTNPNIRIYLNSINENKALRSAAPGRMPFTYASVKDIIENNTKKTSSALIIRDLGEGDLLQLARDFLKEENPQKKEQYLRIFSKSKFPLGYKPLMEIIQGKRSSKHQCFFFGIQALSYFTSLKLRALVVDKLHNAANGWEYLPLLERNYKEGDSKELLAIIEKAKNQDRLHRIAADIVDIYRANPTKDCTKPIEAIYKRLTCSNHREDLMQILQENDVLSKKIASELKYDCSIDTRNLVV